MPRDYPAPDGGYLDNLSTGYAPRFHEEMVRKLFISSAAALVIDFHVDGFRVDQTTSHPRLQRPARRRTFGGQRQRSRREVPA